VVLEARLGDQLSDARSSVFAVRTVGLPEQPDAATVLVNGAPVRLRIAEWRPVDRHYRPAAEATEHLLRLALGAGFNTVRVWAGGGLADEAFYDSCDRLGLLVIQDLPLLGEVGRTPQAALTAATDGVALAVRQRPAVIALGHGLDWAGANTDQRRQWLDAALRRSAPDLLQILPTRSAERTTRWTWLLPAAPGEARQAVPMRLTQVSLPGAPPADLGFLHREKLPLDERATPWPLTDVWRLHSGRDAELDAAAAWLGPVADEAGMLQLLLRRQTALAQREVAGAMAAGGAKLVSPLSSSPQFSGALVDQPACRGCLRSSDGSGRAASSLGRADRDVARADPDLRPLRRAGHRRALVGILAAAVGHHPQPHRRPRRRHLGRARTAHSGGSPGRRARRPADLDPGRGCPGRGVPVAHRGAAIGVGAGGGTPRGAGCRRWAAGHRRMVRRRARGLAGIHGARPRGVVRTARRRTGCLLPRPVRRAGARRTLRTGSSTSARRVAWSSMVRRPGCRHAAGGAPAGDAGGRAAEPTRCGRRRWSWRTIRPSRSPRQSARRVAASGQQLDEGQRRWCSSGRSSRWWSRALTVVGGCCCFVSRATMPAGWRSGMGSHGS